MTRQVPVKPVSTRSVLPLFARVVSLAAVGAACVFALLLSLRLVNSSDLGYHLAYGEQFFSTGRLVDTCPYIYTLAEGPPLVDRSKIGPGCWYDAGGVYHFANANWLSQLVITVLYRWGGAAAMSWMVTAVVAVLLALCLWMMWRLVVPATAAAAGVRVMALAAQGRFQPRPEILGYAMLVVQLYLLLAVLRGRGVISWKALAGGVIVQLVIVNVHSYFLLGLAMTTAVLADQLVRLAWWRWKRQGDLPARQTDRRNSARLGVLLAAQTAACLVNPWTWRLALLPVETLGFLAKYDITATKFPGVRHPWSAIAEFTNTLGTITWDSFSPMSCAILVLLALAAGGCLAALAGRRWGLAMILAGMGAVSLSMLRNAAPASFLIVPMALWALSPAAGRAAGRFRPATVRIAGLAVSGIIVLLSVYWSVGVVTNRFYVKDESAERFGAGFNRLHFPLEAAEWINEHKPVGRMWTDFNLSSDLYYFTRPHRDVPILTNTWAFPPDVMRMVLDHIAGLDFEAMRRRYDIEIVAVENGITAEVLVRTFSNDPNWALVYLSPCHVIFLRKDGPNAQLARRYQITTENLDLAAYRQRVRELDPLGDEAIFAAGIAFNRMRWDSQVIGLLEGVLPDRKPNCLEWNMLGVCYGRRAVRRIQAGDSAGAEDMNKALQCFERAVSIQGDYDKGLQNLRLVRRQIESLQQGVLLVPKE